MSREKLKKTVLIAFAILGCGFLYVLFSSLGGGYSEMTTDAHTDIQKGQTELRRVAGQRVWVTRLNRVQQNSLGAEHPCKKADLCAVPAATNTSGIELVFSKTKPPQLTSQLTKERPWVGGFIDPTNGQVFDLGGKAYQADTDARIDDLAPSRLN